ncbi:MAG: hypothetical protein V2A62_01605 [Candidatus Woesearchaeota archaeon]
MSEAEKPVTWKAYALVGVMAASLGTAAWYFLSYSSPTSSTRPENQAEISRQKGIQSLVCDPGNLQHFNPEECEVSKGLEAGLYWK